MKVVRLQGKLVKQNVDEDMKKVFEPVTESIEKTSEKLTKALTETSNNNNEALESLNDKLLEIMNDRSILASYLMSLLSKITNPGTSSQYTLLKDPNSNRITDLLIHNSIPITL